MLLSTRQQHVYQHTHWIFVTASVLLAATLWSTTIGGASAAPGVFDLSAQQQQTQTLATDLQPPFYTPNADPYSDPTNSRAIDSYGNPIEALKPIVTPDGRKVVSAEGLQFEIPNYASGITELRKPALDLLPPFVAPFDNIAPTGQQTQPLPADRERFPPNSQYGNDGKQRGGGLQPAAAVGGFGQRGNAQNQGSVTRPSPAAPSNPFLPRQPPFAQPSTPTSFTPVPTDTDNLITSSTINNNQNLPFANSVGATVNNGLAKPNPFGVTPVNNRVGGVSGPPQGQQPKKYNWPDFGGPPGVLVPFDNVKSR